MVVGRGVAALVALAMVAGCTGSGDGGSRPVSGYINNRWGAPNGAADPSNQYADSLFQFTTSQVIVCPAAAQGESVSVSSSSRLPCEFPFSGGAPMTVWEVYLRTSYGSAAFTLEFDDGSEEVRGTEEGVWTVLSTGHASRVVTLSAGPNEYGIYLDNSSYDGPSWALGVEP